jgi:hypothetical protein
MINCHNGVVLYIRRAFKLIKIFKYYVEHGGGITQFTAAYKVKGPVQHSMTCQTLAAADGCAHPPISG